MNAISQEQFQRWMQSVIEHSGSDEEAWHSNEAESSLTFDAALQNVNPSKSLNPVERIAIYRRMFYLRMVEAMQIDFPAVLHFLGEEEFNRIISEEYVKKFPSNSYTLNHLGRRFPQFIAESHLAGKEFLFDLARLELAVTENMDLDESPVVSADDVARVPVDAWERVKLIPIIALELLEFDFPVNAYLDAVMEEDEILPEIKRGKSRIVVYRENYTTWRKDLSEEEFVLLSALKDGKTLGESIAILAERFPDSVEELQNNIFAWFNTWIANGMFQKISY